MQPWKYRREGGDVVYTVVYCAAQGTLYARFLFHTREVMQPCKCRREGFGLHCVVYTVWSTVRTGNSLCIISFPQQGSDAALEV